MFILGTVTPLNLSKIGIPRAGGMLCLLLKMPTAHKLCSQVRKEAKQGSLSLH